MKQSEHLFQFTGKKISQAAAAEHKYHQQRLEYWREQQTKLVEQAKKLTAIVKVSEQPITGGKRLYVTADITGVQEINWKLDECGNKIERHLRSADEFKLKAAAYGTQPSRSYELDPVDLQHFRMTGGSREE